MEDVLIRDLHKRFMGDRGEKVDALRGFSLEVPSTQLAVLLGPSGCGKSTVLNCVAGLIEPDAGQIELGGRTVSGRANGILTNVPPDKRDVGMVFQSYALWPHMTVAENVYFPLRVRGMKHAAARPVVQRALDLVQCGPLGDRHPSELSGGQQQRVALARALVGEPRVILFDEPLSNLDAGLRAELREILAMLHKRVAFTGLYVTHDQSEALALGDVVAVMREGRAEQIGSPQEVYNRPATQYVARFFGANVLTGVIPRAGTLRTAFGDVPYPNRTDSVAADAAVAVHSHHIRVARTQDPGAPVVSLARYAGSRWEYNVAAATGEELHVAIAAGECVLEPGEHVSVEVSSEHVHPFVAETMERSPEFATEPEGVGR